jgi:hypothetical protein
MICLFEIFQLIWLLVLPCFFFELVSELRIVNINISAKLSALVSGEFPGEDHACYCILLLD